MLLSLPGTLSSNAMAATPDEVRWSRVNIPAEGDAGNWVLANGSNIRLLTIIHNMAAFISWTRMSH